MSAGACNPCRKTYVWSNGKRLRDALCPKHLTPLRQTRHPYKFPVADTPPAFHSGRIEKPLEALS